MNLFFLENFLIKEHVEEIIATNTASSKDSWISTLSPFENRMWPLLDWSGPLFFWSNFLFLVFLSLAVEGQEGVVGIEAAKGSGVAGFSSRGAQVGAWSGCWIWIRVMFGVRFGGRCPIPFEAGNWIVEPVTRFAWFGGRCPIHWLVKFL